MLLIDREITIKMAPREDGGLRVWSDDLPGLILSHSNQRLVLQDVGNVIAALCAQGKSAAALGE
jgi:hypothetical protein